MIYPQVDKDDGSRLEIQGPREMHMLIEFHLAKVLERLVTATSKIVTENL